MRQCRRPEAQLPHVEAAFIYQRARAQAFAEAGASCFFVPGLADDALIGELCATAALPMIVMVLDVASAVRRVAALGVARISEGPGPFMRSMAFLRAQADGAAQRSGGSPTAICSA